MSCDNGQKHCLVILHLKLLQCPYTQKKCCRDENVKAALKSKVLSKKAFPSYESTACCFKPVLTNFFILFIAS